ncbi:MAG: hypothetical protein AAF772_21055 [Acidobacteriota bacterium]
MTVYRPIFGALLGAVLLCAASPVFAQTAGGSIAIEPEPLACLPVGDRGNEPDIPPDARPEDVIDERADNAITFATVRNLPTDAEVRLYFRRLHDTVEDLYYVRMYPVGTDRFEGIFPEAEARELTRYDLGDGELDKRAAFPDQQPEFRDDDYRWSAWWKAKEVTDSRNPTGELDKEIIDERAQQGRLISRHWLAAQDDETIERWLMRQTNEPAEYFIAVHDAQGARLERTDTFVSEVRDDCEVPLNARQLSRAENLVIGETSLWQIGEIPFHWLCDGLVSRVNIYGVLRGDEVCRACVIAWWKRAAPYAIAGAVTGIAIISADDPDDPVSPVLPQ